MTASLLVARAISVIRDGRRLVDAASVTLEAACITTLSGPSGCGKSTLLRAIATLAPLSSGELLLEGRRACDVGFEAYRRRVAYVPQTPRMFEGSVADNVRIGPAFCEVSLADADVHDLLSRVGLEPALAAREARTLSGGEQLRVALARALANRPQVLLIDEPTASLDPAAAIVVLDALVALAKQGTALLAVTHVEAHAHRLGGSVFRMKAGILGGRPLPS